jgi:hypothetical protein
MAIPEPANPLSFVALATNSSQETKDLHLDAQRGEVPQDSHRLIFKQSVDRWQATRSLLRPNPKLPCKTV